MVTRPFPVDGGDSAPRDTERNDDFSMVAGHLEPRYVANPGNRPMENPRVEPVRGHESARASVLIEAPVAFVWDHLSQSAYARGWSTFFDHISNMPPNPAYESGPPGLGDRRRCYRTAAETGFYWDEEVVAILPLRLRRIYTFNMANVGRRRLLRGLETYTDNIYEAVSGEVTRFTFSSMNFRITRPWAIRIERRLGLYATVEEIFRLNLANIRAQIEADYRGTRYTRPHPWYADYWQGSVRKKAPGPDEVVAAGKRDGLHEALYDRFPPLLIAPARR